MKILLIITVTIFPLMLCAQAEGITVKSSKVGIGTEEPNADLDILDTASVYMRLSNSTSNYSEFREISAQLRINNYSSTGSLIDINPFAGDGSSNQAFRLFRESNSSGPTYFDMFLGDGSTTLNNRIGSKGVNTFFNANQKTLNFGIGTGTPLSQLHVNTADPTSEHTIIAQSDNPATAYTSTFAGVYIRNGNNTNNNFARLNFGDSSNTAGSLGTQITDHANDYGDLVHWTRGPSGFSEKMRITKDGFVGIGTASPAHRLHTYQPSGNNHFIVQSSSNFLAAAAGSAMNPTLYWSAGTDMRFATSTSNLGGASYSEKFIFESDGDLVINPLAAGNARLTVFGTSTDSKPTAYINSGGNDSNEHALYVLARDGSAFSSDVLRLATNRGLSSGYNYIQAIADEDGTPSYPFTVRGDGNVGIKTNNFGTSAAGVLAIGNGTAPSSSPTDQVQLFAADGASVSELKVRDEAGNVTTLSPHNFSLIGNPSHEMAWSYYSEKDGKAINVDMFRVIQLLEELTGEKLIYISELPEVNRRKDNDGLPDLKSNPCAQKKKRTLVD